MKYYKKNIKSLLALTIITILLFSWITYHSRPKIYNSDSMKISFEVPAGSNLEDKFASIEIKNDNGSIFLDRNGTNHSNINDYLSDLNKKNKTSVISDQSHRINNYDVVQEEIVYDNEKNINMLIYFIYIDNFVYSISTSSPELFDELDQIAQSFKYTGN